MVVQVTVNGQPLRDFIQQERSDEITQFVRDELRDMKRSVRPHIASARPFATSFGHGPAKVLYAR